MNKNEPPVLTEKMLAYLRRVAAVNSPGTACIISTNSLRAVLARLPAASEAEPTDPGHDVNVLREHVRHLERHIRQLSASEAGAVPVEATDEMIDAACAVVKDLYRVDAAKIIEAALPFVCAPAPVEAGAVPTLWRMQYPGLTTLEALKRPHYVTNSIEMQRLVDAGAEATAFVQVDAAPPAQPEVQGDNLPWHIPVQHWDDKEKAALAAQPVTVAQPWPMEEQPDGAITPVDPADMRAPAAQGDERAILKDLCEWKHSKACATDGAIQVSWGEIYPFVARARAALVRQQGGGDAERHQAIGAAIELACRELPHGNDIQVHVEKGYAGVRLTDANWYVIDCDREERDLAGEIHDAIRAARAQRAQEGGNA